MVLDHVTWSRALAQASIMQGRGPQLEENPTGTILGNQAIEQQVERIYKTKATNKRKELKHIHINQEIEAELQDQQQNIYNY